MADISKDRIIAANLSTGIASGHGLAIRSIMLDTIQRYYAANPTGSDAEKMTVLNKLVMDAARSHQDGIKIVGMDLTLTPEQKELAGLGWKKLLGTKDAKNVVAFLEDPELKAQVNRLPFVSKETAQALTERAKQEGAQEDKLRAIQERKDAGFTDLKSLKASADLAFGTFENAASRHKIMYYSDAQGKKWELGNSFEAAIEGVKKDLGKTSALDKGIRLAGVSVTSPEVNEGSQLVQLAAPRSRTNQVG